MYGRDILSKVDHTLLKPDATWDAIKVLCDEAVAYKTASIANLFNAGYNPRYFNWKTKLDVINGAFTTTLKSWVSPVTESLLSGWFGFGYNEGDVNPSTKVILNYKFFKVNPSVLDPIFGVNADSTWDTDQLLVNSYIGCYVARNLSRDGVPY